MTKAGHQAVNSLSDCDVVIINTCSVRDNAEQRVLSHLGQIKHMKKSKPGIVVAVIGCMAQRMGDDLLSNPVVDVACGPGQIGRIITLIEEAKDKQIRNIAVARKIRAIPDEHETSELEEFEIANAIADAEQIPGQAYVRAMRGCNKFCTYCIVPYVRGFEASRPPHAIIEQMKQLADNGIKLVTLLGQTVNSYSYTENGKTCKLADLLAKANEINGIEWIRFITSYPSDFDDEIFKAMAKLQKVCPYLHMPAQSGSDRVLKAMNRHYFSGEYLELVAKAREIVPGVAIAGDFIVGFPGETQQDFDATVELVRKVRYKNCYIFKYSPRPGTAADKKLADDISDEIKRNRNMKLLEIQNAISEEDNKKMVGKKVRVLVEGPSKKAHLDGPAENEPQLISRTAEDYIVVFTGPQNMAGQFANIEITRSSALTLFGELV